MKPIVFLTLIIACIFSNAIHSELNSPCPLEHKEGTQYTDAYNCPNTVMYAKRDEWDATLSRKEPNANHALPTAYVCPMCDRVKNAVQKEALVVKVGTFCSLLMNPFPYGPGHVMIVPNRHCTDFTELTSRERNEMMELCSDVMEALKATLDGITGFNIGMNIGQNSGSTVQHLHLHIVPRRPNDAGFLTTLLSTKLVSVNLVTLANKLSDALNKQAEASVLV